MAETKVIAKYKGTLNNEVTVITFVEVTGAGMLNRTFINVWLEKIEPVKRKPRIIQSGMTEYTPKEWVDYQKDYLGMEFEELPIGETKKLNIPVDGPTLVANLEAEIVKSEERTRNSNIDPSGGNGYRGGLQFAIKLIKGGGEWTLK